MVLLAIAAVRYVYGYRGIGVLVWIRGSHFWRRPFRADTLVLSTTGLSNTNLYNRERRTWVLLICMGTKWKPRFMLAQVAQEQVFSSFARTYERTCFASSPRKLLMPFYLSSINQWNVTIIERPHHSQGGARHRSPPGVWGYDSDEFWFGGRFWRI